MQGVRRLLLGDWSPVIRDPLDIARLAMLVGVFVTLAIGPREQSFRLAGTFLLVLVPRRLDAPRPLDLLFLAGMSFQAWGNVFGVFNDVYGYDKVVHFILPSATSALLYLLLVRLHVVPDLANHRGLHVRGGMVLTTFALGLTFGGGLYEIYEWFADTVLGAHLYTSYGDTIADLLDDSIGSLLGGALLVVWSLGGWSSRRGVRGPGPSPATVDMPVPAAARDVSLPRWLVGDWTPWLRDGLDLVRWSLVIGALGWLAAGDVEPTVRFALTALAAFGVRRLQVPRPLDFAFLVAMVFQAWSAALGAGSLTWWVLLSHALVALAFAIVLYLLVVRLRLVPDLAQETDLHQRAGIALVAFALGFSAGIWFEIYVWFADHVLGAAFGVDYDRLIARLAFDAAGALVGGAVLVLWTVRGWGTLRRIPAARLSRAAPGRRPRPAPPGSRPSRRPAGGSR